MSAREKQTHPEHFIDLWHLAGHQTPNDYDPTGTRFAFEMADILLIIEPVLMAPLRREWEFFKVYQVR